MKKYRIKLSSDRIIGPYNEADIRSLFDNDKIEVNSQVQLFPSGKWKLLTETFSFIADHERQVQKERDSIKEFKVDKNVEIKVDYERLEKEYQEKIPTVALPDDSEIEEAELYADFDKTVVNTKYDIYKEVPKKVEKVEEVVPVAEKEVIQNIENDDDLYEEKTEFVHAEQLLSDLNQISNESLEEIKQKEIKQADLEEKKLLKENEKKDADLDDVLDENPEKKRKLKFVVPLTFFVLFYFLVFDEDTEKKATILYPNISFPIVKENIDEQLSNNNLKLGGQVLFNEQDYVGLMQSAEHFKKSLSYKFKNNDSLGFLIYTYGLLLPNAKNEDHAGEILFKLIRIAESKMLKDQYVAAGMALFFKNFGKYKTARRILENFAEINQPKLLLGYILLDVLNSMNAFEDASKVYSKLVGAKTKLSPYQYEVLIDYHFMMQNDDEAEAILKKALKIYPNSSRLYTLESERAVRKVDEVMLSSSLALIKKDGFDSSPLLYAKYLENVGILSAMKGEQEKAAKFMQDSLKRKESQSLRSLLSSLEIGGTEIKKELIKESKIKELLRKSRKELETSNWQKALNYALEATEINLYSVEANTLLSEIQLNRGYFSSAVHSLERCLEKYPLNAQLNLSYGVALVNTKKISAVKELLANLTASNFTSTKEYPSLLGQYYASLDNLVSSIKWFYEAIQRDPVNDINYFELGKLFFKHKRFKKAKEMIRKAAELSPDQLIYRVYYAKILYEINDVDVAIGYLRDLLKTNKNNPLLLGEIAIYYHRSGLIKYFEEYKSKIEALPKKDHYFYRFLINVAKNEGNIKDVINYSIEYLKLRPGELEARKELAAYYMKINKYDEAEFLYNEILDRVKNYPMINAFLSEVYLRQNKLELSRKFANLEIKVNPSIEQGYLALAKVLIKEKKIIESIPSLEKAIQINWKSLPGLKMLAKIKREQQSFEESRELYLRALKQQPNDPEIHRELGYVYKGIGQKTLAIESFSVYLQLLPNAQDAAQIRLQIKKLR